MYNKEKGKETFKSYENSKYATDNLFLFLNKCKLTSNSMVSPSLQHNIENVTLFGSIDFILSEHIYKCNENGM